MSDTDLREEIAELTSEPDRGPLAARKKAMDLLARREHARGELLSKLEKADFDSSIAFDAVSQLTDEGLQSDVRFAEMFVQSRYNQGKGPVRIRAELRERDVSAALVDQVFSGFDGDWWQLASEVRIRKFGEPVPEDFATKAKQMRFLQYRGFDSEQINSALSR